MKHMEDRLKDLNKALFTHMEKEMEECKKFNKKHIHDNYELITSYEPKI